MSIHVEHNSEIENEITNLVVELCDTLSTYNDNHTDKTTDEFIDNYIKHVTRISFRIRKTDFGALRESCVLFHEILNNLKDRNKPLSDNEYEQLEVWPTLILAYISNPDDKHVIQQILSFIKNPLWQYQVNKKDLHQIEDDFYNTNSIANTLVPESEPADMMSAFDGVIFESIQQEILEAMSDLLSDLNSSDDDDEFGVSHSLSLCADRIELLGMSIATAGLLGLMDVCILFQTGLRTLSNRGTAISDQERSIIEEWPTHLITYLASPTDADATDNLVTYLTQIPWLEPMSNEEKMTLTAMLIPEDIELTAPEENLSEDVITFSDTESEIDTLNHDEETSTVSDKMYFLGQELIKLIRDEFELEKSSLEHALSKIASNSVLSEENIEQLKLYKSIIERFSLATESVGLSGLNKTLACLTNNLAYIIENKPQVSDEILNYLNQFPELSLNYLDDMGNENYISALIKPIDNSDWPVKLDYNINSLSKELLSPTLLIEDDIEIRATQATIDDISLALPEDVNQQLLDSLLQELPVQTAEFTESITRLVEGHAHIQDVEKAQRIAHTLKGAANTVGVTGIATLTHHIEDIFDAFSKHQRLPGKKLADVLMNAADILETMSESLLGQGEPPEQAQTVLQQVLDWANIIDNDGIPEDDTEIQIEHKNESGNNTGESGHLKEIASSQILRIPASLMDNLLRLAGESIILGGQLQERLRQAEQQTTLAHKQNELYQQLVFELEQIVDIQGLTAKKPDNKLNDVFDSLELEQYNELHTVTHRLVEAATDSKELTQSIEDELHALNSLLVDQQRVHKENQNVVMQTRMIPVQNIVPRLQRSVRQTCRLIGKKVNLNVQGTETLMDSDVLDELLDPMMHILRNSIDHGIEDENVRLVKNKNETGNIDLTFSRDGDQIVVRCKDDGAGLNFDAIRKTAVNKNIISADTKISDEELVRFIWLAGFTTRNETTQISGRGIGMDAVYNKITSLKGELNISSVKDIGCTVELRLPLTLISVHAILVKLRKQTLAISNRGIEQILSPEDGELILQNNAYTYHYNSEIFNAFDIETLLHQPRDKRSGDREHRTVLLVRDETGSKIAVAVEHIIGNQDLVVKQLGNLIPEIIGIEGATILGDGSVAAVLDLPGLIRTTNHKEVEHIIERLSENEATPDNAIVLIVDDSLSARRSLAEFVKDLGYDVRMARDGIEAIDVIKSRKPDLILVDLEMPRMNGLELTTHLRSMKETKELPIIMITSRSTDKHREMADSAGVNTYLTKPFSEDQLLESIHNLLLTVH